MNWMTSGRKRVQRSQKIKELRAKHFAKVAADRVRALPKPIRSSTSRESADVSRLKIRWVPASHQGQPSSGRNSSGPPIEHDSGAVDTTLLADSSEDIVRPMFDIDTKSPSTFGRMETDGNIEEQTPSITGFTQDSSTCMWPPSEQQRKERASGMVPSLKAATYSLGLGSAKTAFACRGSGESSEVSDIGQDYDSRLLGIECHPSLTMLRTTGGTPLYNNHDAGSGATSSFAGEDDGTPVFSGYCNNQMRIGNAMLPKDNPMRFFDSGIEVALDGSPVSSSTTRYPGQTSTPAAQLRVPLGGSGIGTSASPEATQSAEGGLPKFRTSASLEEAIPLQEKPFSSPEEMGNAFLDNPSLGGEARLTPPVNGAELSRAEEQLGLSIHQSMSDRDNLRDGEQRGMSQKSPQSTEDAPAFEALARNWGLFGGALDSPTIQSAGAIFSNDNPPTIGSEELLRIDPPQSRPCRDGRKLAKNINALQDKLRQPTRYEDGEASESDSPSHVPMETDDVRTESPELVMLWQTNESSSDVEISGKGMVHPSHGMTRECAKRCAESLFSFTVPGNTAGECQGIHPEVPPSHPEVSGASPYPTTAVTAKANRMAAEEVARPVAWPSTSTKNTKHNPRGERLGEAGQGPRVTTLGDTPRGEVDQNQLGLEFDEERRGSGRGGDMGGRGQRKRTLSFEGVKEHSRRSKRPGGDDPCTRQQAPKVAKARLGSPCNKVNSIPRDQESPLIGAMSSVSGRKKATVSSSMDMVRENAPSVLIAGRKHPMRASIYSSRGILGPLSRDAEESGHHVATVRSQGGMRPKHTCTCGSGDMDTDSGGKNDEYSAIVWYRTIVACLMAASTS